MTLYGNRLDYLYTTREEIERTFSTEGASLHTDDLPPLDDFWTELCERASAKVNLFLGSRYRAIDLASHQQIRKIATYIALYYLSKRRGNPHLYGDDYNESITELGLIRDGDLYIDLPLKSGERAMMQNVLIDNRYAFEPMRVLPDSTVVRPGQASVVVYPFLWI
jgi:phage gp36-like protein